MIDRTIFNALVNSLDADARRMNDEFVEELLFVVAQLQRDGIRNDHILAALRAMGGE